MKLFLLISFIGVFFHLSMVSAKRSYSAVLDAEEVSRLKSIIAKKSEAMSERMRLAQHYSAEGDINQVITYLRPVTEKLNTGGLRLLARAYGERKDHLQEIRILEFLVGKNKNDYVSHTRLGNAYFAAEKYEKSIASYNSAIKINKKFRKAFHGLLKALRHEDLRYDLKETLLEMMEIFGPESDILTDICELYYEDGFLSDAFNYCQRAINKEPNFPDNHVYLALTYEAQGKNERALVIIRNAARAFKNSEFAQYTAGKMSENAKNNLSAYRYYKAGALADSQSFRSYFGWAKSAFLIKKYDESLNAFRRACALNRTEAVQEFRSTAARLRSEPKAQSWYRKFKSAASNCRYTSK